MFYCRRFGHVKRDCKLLCANVSQNTACTAASIDRVIEAGGGFNLTVRCIMKTCDSLCRSLVHSSDSFYTSSESYVASCVCVCVCDDTGCIHPTGCIKIRSNFLAYVTAHCIKAVTDLALSREMNSLKTKRVTEREGEVSVVRGTITSELRQGRETDHNFVAKFPGFARSSFW